jgi:Sulfotransferase family
MPIILRRYNIAYFPVPKVACTSLKHLFFLLEHGRNFENYIDRTGIKHHIHNSVYPTLSTSEDDWSGAESMHRIVIVRDPVDRFVSAYSNRVLFYKELSENSLDSDQSQMLGVKPDPDLNEFIDHLEHYRALSTVIKHHTDPQTYFIGHTLDYFNKVYRFEELDSLASDLRERTGQPIVLPHKQKGIAGQLPSLSAKRIEKILEFYSGDYALLEGVYSLELARDKYVSEIKEFFRRVRKSIPL